MSSSPIALVIGDVMLDRRSEGEMVSISREAPAPVIRVNSNQSSLGGAGNVAANIVALGHRAMLMGRIGRDAEGEQVKALANNAGVPACLPFWNVPTIVKHRITCGGQIVCRLDTEQTDYSSINNFEPDPQEIITGLTNLPADMIANIKVVVVADYNKGTMDTLVIRAVMAFCAANSIPLFVDCRPAAVQQYAQATLIKPNLRESLEMLSWVVHPGLADSANSQDQAAVCCQQLKDKYGFHLALVTNGRHGCCYTDPDDGFRVHFCDAIGQHGVDTAKDICGAGDTVMAAVAVGMMEGKSFSSSVDFAMAAAGYVVQFHGVHVATRDDVEEFSHGRGNWTNKLMTPDTLLTFLSRRRRMQHGLRVVFTNGCFDGLHSGHIELLRFAKRQGDLLVVAYNDDTSLISLKGEGRPHVPDSFRASHLALQDPVDAVVRFNGDVMSLLRHIKPEVLVKGADAGRQPIPGADYVAQHGGQVLLCPLDDFSITIDRSQTTK